MQPPNTPGTPGSQSELETLDLSLKKAFEGSNQQQRPSVLVSAGAAHAQLQEEPMDFSTKTPASVVVPQSPQALVCSTPQLSHQQTQVVHQLQCSIQSHPQTVNQIATVQSHSVQLQQQQQQQQQQPLQGLQLHVQQTAAAQTQLATTVQPQQTLQQIILQQSSAQQQQQAQLCISAPPQIQLASQLQSTQVWLVVITVASV